jgi:hypothetical protein
MALATEHLEIAQLYVRWPPERASVAIELRLELVSQLSMELARGAQQGIEIGGVMLGRVLQGRIPTLRVEAVEMIRRRLDDGPTFLLNPRQLNLFKEICLAAKSGERVAIGLFRTHLRSELLRPSAADRGLISEQFEPGPHAFLVVQARAPHQAAFFVTNGTELPAEPAIDEFLLNEAALKTLPEVPAEESGSATRPLAEKATHNRSVWLLGALALVFAALFAWLVAREPLRAPLNRSPNQINLGVTPAGDILQIHWSHSAREIARAKSAVLTILDGPRRVQLPLSPDDLRFGSVEYQRHSASRAVSVSMTLAAPDLTIPIQSISWSGG